MVIQHKFIQDRTRYTGEARNFSWSLLQDTEAAVAVQWWQKNIATAHINLRTAHNIFTHVSVSAGVHRQVSQWSARSPAYLYKSLHGCTMLPQMVIDAPAGLANVALGTGKQVQYSWRTVHSHENVADPLVHAAQNGAAPPAYTVTVLCVPLLFFFFFFVDWVKFFKLYGTGLMQFSTTMQFLNSMAWPRLSIQRLVKLESKVVTAPLFECHDWECIFKVAKLRTTCHIAQAMPCTAQWIWQ